jgi:predicted GNAT family acetyltransferase
VAAETVEVRDNPGESRYELLVDGRLLGMILYRREDGIVTLYHTEVAPELEGRGLGGRLVADALADLRARGLRLVPRCPFVAAYLRRHPEESDLVAAG